MLPLLAFRVAEGREVEESGEELKLFEFWRCDFLRDSLELGGDLEEEGFLGALGGSGR